MKIFRKCHGETSEWQKFYRAGNQISESLEQICRRRRLLLGLVPISLMKEMAIIFKNKDGTYASKCALCKKPLREPIFATSHFIGDPSHDLFRFSDAGMHWDCYSGWRHQARFASLYFEARNKNAEGNAYWPVVWKSTDALVTYGVAVDEVSIVMKKSGTDQRVKRSAWPAWLSGEWRNACRHVLELKAVEELIPHLEKLSLPEPGAATSPSF